MRSRFTFAVLPALFAVSAGAAPPERPLPELEAAGRHLVTGVCAGRAFRTTIDVPILPVFESRGDGWTAVAKKAEEEAKERMIAARRLTAVIENGAARVAGATNECDDERELDVFRSTAEAAVQDAAESSLPVPPGTPLSWVPVAWRAGPDEPAWRPAAGRFSGACRAPELDDVLYAPDGPGLSPGAQAKLEDIGKTAVLVATTLRAQKTALDDLLPLAEGRRCLEILSSFDALVREERRQFFAYREKAVAGSIWSDLVWKKAAP